MFKSISVRDYMVKNIITIKPDIDVLYAVSVLLKNNISGAPVVDDDDNLLGILSEKDCLRIALESGYNEGRGGKVSDYMSKTVTTINADYSIIDAAKAFLDTPFKRFPVVENGELVGQISRRDVLRAIDGMMT